MIENRLEEGDRVVDGTCPRDLPAGAGRDAGRVLEGGREGTVSELAAAMATGEPGGGEGPQQDPEQHPRQQDDECTDESLVRLEGAELQRAVEAILFSLSEPISIRALSELVGATVHEVRQAVEDLRLEYVDGGRAFRVEDVAGGVQLLTLRAYDAWIRRLRKTQREGRLSPAALETLAVVAYKQPIQKADLEAIRGVNCSQILKTLLDRGLVKIVGRGEGLGRPLLYGTTKRFLESFGIASIRELPQPETSAPFPGKPQDDPGKPPEALFEDDAQAEAEETDDAEEGSGPAHEEERPIPPHTS